MSYDRTTVSASWKTKVIRRTKEVAEQSTKRIAGGKSAKPHDTCVLDRRGVFGGTCQYRLSSAAAVKQIRVGHRRALQWVPARTPTVHWGLNCRKAVEARLDQTADTRQTFYFFTFILI